MSLLLTGVYVVTMDDAGTEHENGWVLVEKFDNGRLRFKRPASARAGDAALLDPGGVGGGGASGGAGGFDPYRTTYGMSEGRLAAVIVTIIVAVIALAIGIIVAATRP